MKRLQLRLVLWTAVVLALAAGLLAWCAARHFRTDLPPEMARTVATVGYSISSVLEKADDNGIVLDQLVGVEEFLSQVRKDNPGIAYILLSDPAGRVLYRSGAGSDALAPLLPARSPAPDTLRAGAYFHTSLPLVYHSQRVGTLHLGQPASLVEQQLREVAYDILTALVVASLIALELMRFVLSYAIAAPADVMRDFLARVRQGDYASYLPFDRLGGIGQLSGHFNAIVAELNRRYHVLAAQAAQQPALAAALRSRLAGLRFHAVGQRPTLHAVALAHIRWPFFLLIFADSMSLSFFPLFVGQFYTPGMGLSKSVVVGLPISIFMFTWALSMPWAGLWSDRVGHRKAFIAGAAVTTAGLVLTACTQGMLDLLLWRAVTALGYGLVFITAQSYVVNHTPPAQRTRGMAMFLSSFFAGSLSGSAIGGILADRLGYPLTFLLSALLSACAALFVLSFLHAPSAASADAAARRALTLRDFQVLLRNKKFSAVTFLAAIPAKIALTGFLYYAVPLYLKLQGSNQSTTGRVMMLYGLAIIALSPFAAKLADRIGHLRWFVSLGGYAAALAMGVIYCYDNMAGLLVSITLLGLAHAVGVSPQLALINDFCQEVVQEVGRGTATGIFRLIERLGNVLGPIISALLIARFGFRHAFLGIGLLSLVCITCFTAMFFWFDRAQSRTAAGGA